MNNLHIVRLPSEKGIIKRIYCTEKELKKVCGGQYKEQTPEIQKWLEMTHNKMIAFQQGNEMMGLTCQNI